MKESEGPMKYFRKLVGEKCYLSPINPDDAETYTQWVNDLEVTAYMYLSHQVLSLSKEREIVEKMAKEGHVFAIVDKEKDQLIGNCGLDDISSIDRTAELGIFIGDKEYWNKGYGSEATTLLLDFGFSLLNLNNIMLRVFSFNQRGIQCYRKCGFKEIGRRRQARIIGRKQYDVLYMDILSEEFTKSVLDDLIREGSG